MTLTQAEEIVEMMLDNGYDAEVREDYSGRGMFGGTCPGIITAPNSATVIGFFAHAAGVMVDDLPERCDNMGLDMIYY